ncbi:MAG TPA: hypothetical protein VNR67_07335 [Solirubrobacterales bacterium]|nr:hypothetical protein [Solirubrobacterales bacterium]
MELVLALTATQKGAVLLAISGIAAPIAGWLFHRSAATWSSFGKGPFAINSEVLPSPRGAPAPLDPAMQAAEVRQMLEAKSARQRRRGEQPLDVEAETERLLASAERPRGTDAIDAELRVEVRQLVIARNERRLREGKGPLDVEAETEKQLADLIGSG